MTESQTAAREIRARDFHRRALSSFLIFDSMKLDVRNAIDDHGVQVKCLNLGKRLKNAGKQWTSLTTQKLTAIGGSQVDSAVSLTKAQPFSMCAQLRSGRSSRNEASQKTDNSQARNFRMESRVAFFCSAPDGELRADVFGMSHSILALCLGRLPSPAWLESLSRQTRNGPWLQIRTRRGAASHGFSGRTGHGCESHVLRFIKWFLATEADYLSNTRYHRVWYFEVSAKQASSNATEARAKIFMFGTLGIRDPAHGDSQTSIKQNAKLNVLIDKYWIRIRPLINIAAAAHGKTHRCARVSTPGIRDFQRLDRQ